MNARPISLPVNEPMSLFVARQPIFRRDRSVAGYELLFRTGPENVFPVGIDPDQASREIIGRALSVFGLDTLVGSEHVAYVNLTQQVLIEGSYECLPPGRVVLEVLETSRPDAEMIAACRQARAAGYTLALDDFTDQPELAGFLSEIDVLKVDFRGAASEAQRRAIAARVGGGEAALLAEKVENEADFALGCELGFSFFQGFFFCRPQMLSRRDIPVSKLVYLQFLAELNRPELDFARIEQVIKQDVALSVKLLRYLKASAFGWRTEVTSIKHALRLLGERPFRRWASVLVMAVLAGDRPAELLTTCLVRARVCERLAAETGLAGRELDLFLVGLFSLMDAVVGRPLEELLADVSLPGELSEALKPEGKPSRIRDVLALALAYERASWSEVDALCTRLAMQAPQTLPGIYEDAVRWAATTTQQGQM